MLRYHKYFSLIHSHYSLSCFCTFKNNNRIIKFGINNIEQEVNNPKNKEYLPSSLNNNPFLKTIEAKEHIKWIIQKNKLKQDMLLIGENIHDMRSCILEWIKLSGKEFEFLSLSQDTAHEDLRQRRELQSNSSIFVDQVAVRAAIHGRILVLEGIERVERNILPLLNNLLENREITLEDGKILLPPDRANSLEKLKSNQHIIHVHNDFRVIGLMKVNNQQGNSGIQLDPPLRSRFQARYIPSLSISSLLDISKVLSPQIWNISPKLIKDYVKIIDSFASYENDFYKELITPPYSIPSDRYFSFLQGLEQMFPSFEEYLTKENKNPNISSYIHRLFERTYPYTLLNNENYSTISNLLKKYNFAVSSNNNIYPLKITNIKSSSSSLLQKKAEININQNNNSFVMYCDTGKGSLSKNIENISYVPTNTSENIIAEMIQDHSLDQDFCLVGDTGTGKTILIQEFAKRLGYSIENMLLYKDMTSRDLVLRRITKKTENSFVQDTAWEYTPLIKAAIEGNIAVLDNIDRLSPTSLLTLSSLLQDRFLHLFNGDRLISTQRFNELQDILKLSKQELLDKGIIPIHPSFRIIATTHKNNEISADLLELFHFHSIPNLSSTDAKIIFSSLVPGSDSKIIERLIYLNNELKTSYSHLNMNYGTREMIRTLQKIKLHKDKEYKHAELYRCISNSCLTAFTPKNTQREFRDLLYKLNLPTNSKIISNQSLLDNNTESKYNLCNKSNIIDPKTAHLIPQVIFHENESQNKILDELCSELILGHHILLIGNQGVGKNKLCDYLLQQLNLPRQYIQLHRDVTVQSIISQNILKHGGLQIEDSCLIEAVREGQVLVIDEADKAPREVVCVLKGLIDGEMILPDGRKIVSKTSPTWINVDKNDINTLIPIHDDFRMIVLANRPNWPFQGNDFYAECGELFSCHAITNPDKLSQIEILKKYAPNINIQVLTNIVNAFDELREYAEHGMIAYPYSTRECVSVVKHLNEYPQDSISTALSNVLAFDSQDNQAKQYIINTFKKYKIPLDSSVLYLSSRQVVNKLALEKENINMWFKYDNNRTATQPKHGKDDPDNKPHVGGNTWKGGTGGADTAGLGGKGGPYRCDKGHPVHQISDKEKQNISKEALEAARKMGQEELQKRLKDIDMNPGDALEYEKYLESVRKEIDQLRLIIESLQNKGKERKWIRNKSSGDLDDTKLIDALAGDKAESDTSHWKSTNKDKKYLHFVLDISGSMYRFNGYDQRLERMLEIAVIIMESLSGFEDKLSYSITGHSGDTPKHMLVNFNKPPTNRKDRYKVLRKMVTYSQFCLSGDHTIEAAKNAINNISNIKSDDDKFVFLFSDANFERYGIPPERLGTILSCKSSVKAYAFFIASFWDEAKYIISNLPKGKGHAALTTNELPQLFKTIFRKEVLK